ncbi:Protein of uncharacterised function DUF116 [Fusobacterium necrogenes]|uniref:Protein of uncharacterized function DUF116 n=1 Tax=Fusobacterium necrogenes TaxID=858 RepID=A0A377GWC9_9FUSO|nr:DUF116 domain-containing protein [Fusobacterium necrogenes]STO31236.1 Protein of uncharacterised function DUF116 [Fusobacterium necrogenes]
MKDNFFTKIIYETYYLMFLLSERKKKQKEENSIATKFLNYNNKRVFKDIKQKKIEKVLILLPHCLQKYSCPLKITSSIENCKKCGQCVIGDFLKIQLEFPVDIKVATGGTLARKHIKDIRPDLVMAIACKRDLIAGIHDSYPVNVYGVFNEIKDEPCINTTVSIKKVREFLKEVF